jgi:uncharacterized iron-regulated membrane protein
VVVAVVEEEVVFVEVEGEVVAVAVAEEEEEETEGDFTPWHAHATRGVTATFSRSRDRQLDDAMVRTRRARFKHAYTLCSLQTRLHALQQP